MYVFQEYPKWINNKIVNSREEEDAQSLRSNEGQIPEKGNEIKGFEEESGENLQFKESEESSTSAHDEGKGDEETPEHPGVISERAGYNYDPRYDPQPDEIIGDVYKCNQCYQEYTKVAHFRGHKRKHEKQGISTKSYNATKYDPMPEELLPNGFKCMQCGREYSHQASFRKHKQQHEFAMVLKYGNSSVQNEGSELVEKT